MFASPILNPSPFFPLEIYIIGSYVSARVPAGQTAQAVAGFESTSEVPTGHSNELQAPVVATRVTAVPAGHCVHAALDSGSLPTRP